MTEQSQTDEAGITRTPTGEINNPVAPQGTTGQPAESKPTTTPTPTEPKSILNQEAPAEPKAEDKPAEGDKKPEADTKVPEKYDFKLPEGFTLDEGTTKTASELFKGMGLNQENAQKLVDFYVGQQKAAVEAGRDAFAKTTAEWLKTSQDHPDLRGKLGPGQDVNVRISRFLDGMKDPQLASEFKQLMDLTGAGNHQAFIRVLDYAARRLTEGSHVAGNGPATAGQSSGNRPAPTAAEAMWPNLANRT